MGRTSKDFQVFFFFQFKYLIFVVAVSLIFVVAVCVFFFVVVFFAIVLDKNGGSLSVQLYYKNSE